MNRTIPSVAPFGVGRTMSPLLSLGGLLLALATTPALAETTTPQPLPRKAPETGPTVPPPAATGGMHGGVIRPPTAVDPAMPRSTPDPGRFPTPVVPPPPAGGDRRVRPK